MNNWCICWFFMYPLNAELNPICHLLATIFVVSRLRVKYVQLSNRRLVTRGKLNHYKLSHHQQNIHSFIPLVFAECGDMDWIELAQDRDRWCTLVNVSALHCHLPGAFLVPSEKCSIEEHSTIFYRLLLN